MEENYCKNCQYFIQHYALIESRLLQVYYGHCVYTAPKIKRPSRKACEHFIQGVNDMERFVSKEYLSKRMLDRVLNMELLPDIGDFSNYIRSRG